MAIFATITQARIYLFFYKCMNNNGGKISSKYFLTLIFTALFFSVTFNSPANYSAFGRFFKVPISDEDTTRPVSPAAILDTVPSSVRDTVPVMTRSDYDTARAHLPSIDRSY